MVRFAGGVLPVLGDGDVAALDGVAAGLVSGFRESFGASLELPVGWGDRPWYQPGVDSWIDDGWWLAWAERLLAREPHDSRAIEVLLTLDRARGLALLSAAADERLAYARECGYWHDEMYDAGLLLELGPGHGIYAMAFDDEEYLRDTQLERARYGLGVGDGAMLAAVRGEVVRRLDGVRRARGSVDRASGEGDRRIAREGLDSEIDSVLEFAASLPGSVVRAALPAEALGELRAVALKRAGAAFVLNPANELPFFWPRYEPALTCAAALGWAEVGEVLAGNPTFEAALHGGMCVEERMCETALGWSLADPGPRGLVVAARAMFPESKAQREAEVFERAGDALTGKWQWIGGVVQASVRNCRLGGAVAWTRCRGTK